MEEELEDMPVEEESRTEELDTPTDELEDLTTEELEAANDELEETVFALLLDAPADELEEVLTDERSDEELDPDEILELEKSSPEEDEPICQPLEDISPEDEFPPSTSVPLFPLSPTHAAKIKATATIPNNAIRCFIFSPCLRPWNRYYLG